MILAIDPTDCEENDVENIMRGIHSWDLCDLFCKTVLIKQPNFREKIVGWIKLDNLFYKRAAFTLIASVPTHSMPLDAEIEQYFEMILQYSEDDRTLVKKAVSWALRELGKINEDSRDKAILAAQKLENQGSKTQVWIAKDALKELETLVKVSGRNRLISSNSKMGRMS